MKTLHQIAFFMLPAAVLFLVLRIPIVRIAYGARELLWRDTVLLGRLVAIYAIAIAAHAMIHVVLRAFYALKETRLPFYVASLGMILNVFIMWMGAYVLGWGIMAVAIGPTIAAIAELLLLLFLLFRRIGFFSPQEFFVPQLKMILATLAMGISLYIPMKYLDQLVFDTTRVLGLLALTSTASLAGFIVYLLFSKLLQVEQLSILGSIQGKLRNWKTRLSGTTEVIATNESTDL